ncbi:MAG: hypothetical protein JW807_07550 [Spirochaetes bacterium]|nr:hypothetical protein [Spirochaetota bacterium]
MQKKIIITVCLVLAGIAALGLITLKDAGEFKKLAPHSSCTCVKVHNVLGAEDIAIDPSTGTAFISSHDRRAYLNEGKLFQGALFGYELAGRPRLRNLTAGLKMPFHPHGISFYRAPDGRRLLFVINHVSPLHTVEIFEYDNGALAHRETVTDPLMISPNDITAVGPRLFYFTNDHGSGSGFAKKMEEFLRLPRSNIVYYDGAGARVVAGGLAYANGIWAGAAGKLLYASTTTGKKFYVFRRGTSGALTLLRAIDIGTAGDNIDVDARGTIRVTCHPKMLTFLRHAADEANRAPSQILEVRGSPEDGYSFTETYLDGGTEISAASVAAGYREHLLIGSVFEPFFLHCKAGK